MKKVLLTSTALVASAGMAAADVSLSGSAELGVAYYDSTDDATDNEEVQFHTDIDVTFTMSGETDGGLTFGASIDLDEGGNGEPFEDANTQGGETIFVSGNFGTINMGDTDGAFDRAMNEAIIGGALNDDHEHGGYNGNAGLDGTYDGQIVRYDYSFSDFQFSVSAEIDDAGVGDPVFGLGFQYDLELAGVDLGLGLGYQSVDDGTDDIDLVGFSVDASFGGGIEAILNYSTEDDGAADTDHIGLAVGYSFDAVTVAANWGEFDTDGATTDGIGFVVNYDLGGGAEAQFGYGTTSEDGADDVDTWSLGLALSF
ncbi:MAG: porin [Pseudomonadota bacterium]